MPRGFLPAVLVFCGVVVLAWAVLLAVSTPREIRTEIIIDAPLAKVWQTLVDFDQYAVWNPFIPYISGPLMTGSRLDVRIAPPGGSAMTFRPRVDEVVETRVIQWRGDLGVPGLFDGVHRFEISFHDIGKTKLVQQERFTGLLVGPFTASMLDRTEAGFKEMNEALKRRCETAK